MYLSSIQVSKQFLTIILENSAKFGVGIEYYKVFFEKHQKKWVCGCQNIDGKKGDKLCKKIDGGLFFDIF